MSERELRNLVISEAAKVARQLHECDCGCDFCAVGDMSPGADAMAPFPEISGGGYDYDGARVDGAEKFVAQDSRLTMFDDLISSLGSFGGGEPACGGGVDPYSYQPEPVEPPAVHVPTDDYGLGGADPVDLVFDTSYSMGNPEVGMFETGDDVELPLDAEDGELLTDDDSTVPKLPAPTPTDGDRASLFVQGYTDHNAAYNTMIGLGIEAQVADDAIDFADTMEGGVFLGVWDIGQAYEMADSLQHAGVQVAIETEGDYWSGQEMGGIYEEDDEQFDNPLDGDTGYEYIPPRPNTHGLNHEMAARTACQALEDQGIVCTPSFDVGLLQVSSDVPVLTVRRIIDAALPDWQSETGEEAYVVQTPRGIIVQF